MLRLMLILKINLTKSKLNIKSGGFNMSKIIIGIHGLANKPKEATLTDWWKKSISEGLEKNFNLQNPSFNYKMIYWADLMYKYQQHTDENFTFDKLYNNQPYIEAEKNTLKEYRKGLLIKLKAGAFDKIGDGLDYLKSKFNIDALADWMLGKVMKDLAYYYDNNPTIVNRSKEPEQAKKILRDELKNALINEKENEILLIAHSMGSIIAYDVLRDLGNKNGPDYEPDLEIPYFLTIGSPLGLPHVKRKIIQERNYDEDVRTPSIVTKKWTNIADKDDKVALDLFLKDDYGENKHGVRVKDDLVANDYHGLDGKANPHKSYGYLRTPELSKCVKEFLEL